MKSKSIQGCFGELWTKINIYDCYNIGYFVVSGLSYIKVKREIVNMEIIYTACSPVRLYIGPHYCPLVSDTDTNNASLYLHNPFVSASGHLYP